LNDIIILLAAWFTVTLGWLTDLGIFLC